MAVGHFEVYKTPTKKWRFRLKAGNGEIICSGEEYETRQGCLKGVASIQRNALKAEIEIIDDSKKLKRKEDLTHKQLVKKIRKEEKNPSEEVSDKQRDSDEKKILVNPKGAPRWKPRKIPLPGSHGPRWL